MQFAVGRKAMMIPAVMKVMVLRQPVDQCWCSWAACSPTQVCFTLESNGYDDSENKTCECLETGSGWELDPATETFLPTAGEDCKRQVLPLCRASSHIAIGPTTGIKKAMIKPASRNIGSMVFCWGSQTISGKNKMKWSAPPEIMSHSKAEGTRGDMACERLVRVCSGFISPSLTAI